MGWIYLSFKNMVEDDAKNFIVANFEDGQNYERQERKEMNFEDQIGRKYCIHLFLEEIDL